MAKPVVTLIELTVDSTKLPVWINVDLLVGFQLNADNESTILVIGHPSAIAVEETPAEILLLLGY